MTLHVALVVPDRELWSGEARTVIAKTTEGDIGVLTGHSPVFGILAEGSLVEILTDETSVKAAVSGGFLSVADDQVSILAAQAQLGEEVDVARRRARSLTPRSSEASPARRSRPRPSTPGRCCGPQGTRLNLRWAGALALDAAWLFAAFLVILILAAAGIAARRFLLERGGGTVECGLRKGSGSLASRRGVLPARGTVLVRHLRAVDAAGRGLPAARPDRGVPPPAQRRRGGQPGARHDRGGVQARRGRQPARPSGRRRRRSWLGGGASGSGGGAPARAAALAGQARAALRAAGPSSWP